MKVNFSATRRNGLTLIECLVVITIVGILASLLIPAVLSARESMRRAQCLNNLKQMGLALHSYASVNGAYPAGNNGRGVSMHTLLLPYLEQAALYDSLNLTVKFAMISPTNETSKMTALNVFSCPSESLPSSFGTNNNYPANNGTFFETRSGSQIDDGSFPTRVRGLTDASITDGLSNTSAIAEWRRNQTVIVLRLKSEVGLGAGDIHDLCLNARHRPPEDYIQANWFMTGLGYSLYNHLMNINQNTCMPNSIIGMGAWTAGSHHPNGTNVLFMDGHASFMEDRITLEVWRSMSTRAGGEIAGSRL